MYQAAAALAQELDIASVPARSGVAGPLDGGAGVLVYVNRGSACTIPLATDRNIEGIGVAPSGRVAFAVGQNYSTGTNPTFATRIIVR